MSFAFQRFTDVETPFAARITVRQTGQLGFNAGAINRFKINDFAFAVLYFDPDQKAVGIQLTNEKEAGAIEIKKADSNTYIRAKNFCDRFGIDYSDSHRFELKLDEVSRLIYFELSKELKEAVKDAGDKDASD